MPSERIQRQIDALLDEADAALKQRDWGVVKERAEAAQLLDPEIGTPRNTSQPRSGHSESRFQATRRMRLRVHLSYVDRPTRRQYPSPMAATRYGSCWARVPRSGSTARTTPCWTVTWPWP